MTDPLETPVGPWNVVGRNWLHNRYFSLLAYVPAVFVGSLTGMVGFLTALEISESGISMGVFEVPAVAFGLYGQLLDYLAMTLGLCSIAMAPVTFVLLRSTHNWHPNNAVKYALLGMPVAALYVVGQVTVWVNDMGDIFLEAPIGTATAIVFGGAAGGLSYLGVAALSGLSAPREDAAI